MKLKLRTGRKITPKMAAHELRGSMIALSDRSVDKQGWIYIERSLLNELLDMGISACNVLVGVEDVVRLMNGLLDMEDDDG